MKVKLTTKQVLFCEYFTGGTETCGNALQSYALAYGFDLSNKSKYQSAKTNASRLLNNPAINAHIAVLLKRQKLSPELVDKQLELLIQQNANLTVKLNAINTYYKVHGKIRDEIHVSGLISERAKMLAKRYVGSSST